ncbi:MAG: DUF1294 domain-containing protein [Clostridia bacterium]|nr:DUF1294 domain-containing protein [Clostridia bacterium]
MIKYLPLVYFILVSAISVVITVYDKNAARNRMARIPEKTLFFMAIIGGSLAMFFSMCFIHHKTKQPRFMIGLPIITTIQITGMILLFLSRFNI